MSGTEIDEIKQLAASLKAKCAKIDQDFNEALAEREKVARIPIPRDELYQNLCAAIDEGAAKYTKYWKSQLHWLAQKRGADAHGINKSPDPFREVGNYHELDINALHYFYGDMAKMKLKELVDGANIPDGLIDKQYAARLAEADKAVDLVAGQREALQLQLEVIGFKS
jgi:hypothetical protein